MSTAPKYKIGDKINNIEIIGVNIGSNLRYKCKCKCGNILNKNINNIEKYNSCIKCPDKKIKVRTDHKYSIGDKIKDWEVIKIIPGNTVKRCKYILKCKCGTIVNGLNKNNNCKICTLREKTKKKIGEIYGCFKVIDVFYEEGDLHQKLKVSCINCNKKYIKTHQITPTKHCVNCIDGYFPGKVIEGITLIERTGKGYWNLKCRCGKIYKSALTRYNGKLQTCGCKRRDEAIEKAKQKIGLKYGELKIIKLITDKPKNIYIELKCKCGNKITRPNGNEFKSKSCGCKWHGHSNLGEKSRWCKLTDVEVESLRDLYLSNCYSLEELSKIFNITVTYTKLIIKEKVRKNCPN